MQSVSDRKYAAEIEKKDNAAEANGMMNWEVKQLMKADGVLPDSERDRTEDSADD